jgi:hypothetical protein
LSNLIIPSFTFFENDYFFLNIEGRLRKSLRVLTSNENLITESNLFNFLNIFKDLYIKNNFSIFKNFSLLFKYFDFLNLNFDLNFDFNKILIIRFNILNKFFFVFENFNLNSFVYNYYKLDIYSRNSSILHLASYDYLVKLNIFI